jgi:two-component system, chemotaxis family, CheB/CheR fusion protein
VVDRDFRVLAWNERAEDLWGLRKDEVNGQHFLNLDIGLPVDQLRPALRKCMQGESEEEAVNLLAINRRGKTIHCQVTCTPLRGPAEIRGAILHMADHGDGKP